MRNPYRARVAERHFLNLPGFHGGAFVHAYVEDTSERGLDADEHSGHGYNPEPRMVLEIADCAETIELEFELHSAARRRNSFHKIDTLIAALEAFRDGMAEEAMLYRAREAELVAARNAEAEKRRRAKAIAAERARVGRGRRRRELRIAAAREAGGAVAAAESSPPSDV